MIFEVSEDLFHQGCHFGTKENVNGLVSEVFSSLLFQMDLVEFKMVQKMATETIGGIRTTVI